jgi:hypothetical protein
MDGLEFYRTGKVESVKETDRNAFDAFVRDPSGELQTVNLLRDKEGWIGDCTCDVGEDCEHCCAAMYALLLADPKQFKKTVVVPVKKETFHAMAVARARRVLTQVETDAAKAVDTLFEDHRGAMGVVQSLVDVVAGRKVKGWAYQTIPLWPDLRPKTVSEAWMLIAAYFRRNSIPLLPLFSEMTDWNAVDEFVGAWEREQSVEGWMKRLSNDAMRRGRSADTMHDLRLRILQKEMRLEWRKDGVGEFKPITEVAFRQLVGASYSGAMPLEGESLGLWRAYFTGYDSAASMNYDTKDAQRILNTVLRDDRYARVVCGAYGEPMIRAGRKLEWRVNVLEGPLTDYAFSLGLPSGEALPPPLVAIDGEPSLYVTSTEILEAPPLGGLSVTEPIEVPAEAIETEPGVALFERLRVTPPERLAKRVKVVNTRAILQCRLEKNGFGDGETLQVRAYAERDGVRFEQFGRDGWFATKEPVGEEPDGMIIRNDRNSLVAIPAAITSLKATWAGYDDPYWQKSAGKKFAEQFSEWLAGLSPSITLELDPMLGSLREPAIAARVKLEVEESDIDWFDIKIALDVQDTTLTKSELKALLDARGGFVRLGSKGWRRLAFELSPEDEEQFAEIGLSARDFDAGPQKLHALQLAGRVKNLLPERAIEAINTRVADIKTRVTPPVPAGLNATLRPYQEEGFHFLAYLSTNRFGGILADDMGLGKTVQTLAWLLWLKDRDVEPAPEPKPGKKPAKVIERATRDTPSLVVAPKSVVENWKSEALRFAPGLRVEILGKGACDAKSLDAARANADIVVMNYVHLRLLEKEAVSVPWRAVILDEAQAIKNPDSATAKAAWALNSPHRIALSGTPIENRLLDLWSIMSFTMPGVLGHRAAFGKTFDQRTDPFARRRLAARTRPFILRRTKGEVAKDLPDRIEEDIICEMDTEQATLYRAELKRARMALLKLETKADLDKARFNILTSLLRLRQICCHPGLVSAKATDAESAKMNALMDLIEPLAAEGHKVLVFSQFVEMLSRIEKELAEKLGDTCKLFKLTGQTENRGELVKAFQGHQGAATFLVSLRAGGFGLNLTAASYVVLFDPWWNPAVENQAIDRTHRIGQVNKVIAYRLVVKDSIEEKIRGLQKQKSALAADILGEENFARALTMDDFQFLLSE